ncbi:MAG: NADP-dependent isocitrate dehydrogenase [Thiotrichaceae bacterium]
MSAATLTPIISHFYLAMYWAQALAEQTDDADLQVLFKPIAKQLSNHEKQIVKELNAVQGKTVDLGGYYKPDRGLMSKIMRPSETLNALIDGLG